MAEEDPRAKAAFAVAKHAVERALDDAMLSDEERAKRRAEETALARGNRNKRIAQIVIGGLIVIGLIGLILNYWYWALLLGVVGAGGWYLRRRWRARRAERKKEPKQATRSRDAKPEPAALREAPARKRVKIEEPARAPAEVSDESIDEDLAELKARMKR